MLKLTLLLYKTLRGELRKMDFEIKSYDPCVINCSVDLSTSFTHAHLALQEIKLKCSRLEPVVTEDEGFLKIIVMGLRSLTIINSQVGSWETLILGLVWTMVS